MIRMGTAALCLCLLTTCILADDNTEQAQLAKAWQTFYAGQHKVAVKQTLPLMKASDRSIAIEAAYLQARGLWAEGSRGRQAKAASIWGKLAELKSSDAALATRLKIASALRLAATADVADLRKATESLEAILKEGRMNLATPEAAIALGDIHRRAGQFDEAKKAYQFAIDLLSNEKTLRKMELADETLAKPHLDAARNGLKQIEVDRDAGRAEFEAAEQLRRQKKYREAYRAYQAVAKDFADTDYAPRSELHMGDCMVGLGATDRAIQHWKAFIKPQPAGPWRAQAYMRIIDHCLEEQFDLAEAGKYAELARASLPTAVDDEKAGPSWQAAGFDVQLRVGIVKFCQGKDEFAAQAFDAARQLADNKDTAKRMAQLAAAAKSGKQVIPTDCQADNAASAEGKASLVLSMGTIYMVAGRWDRADDCFDRILGTPAVRPTPGKPGRRATPPMPGASKAQQAFAIFGRGAVLHHHRRTDQAVEQFLASLKAFPDGTWHDETLYCVAAITQDLASAKFAKAPEPANPSAKPLTAKQREAKEKAESECLASLEVIPKP
jgi:tetratricopeptide (TPR) repeat protein